MHTSYVSVGLPTGPSRPYKANHNLQAPRNTLYNLLYFPSCNLISAKPCKSPMRVSREEDEKKEKNGTM